MANLRLPKRALTKRPLPTRQPYPPEVQALTESLRELIRQSNKTDVVARAEIGARLARIRDQLSHGVWLGWLEREVPFTPRSAQIYIELARFAQGDPARFNKVAELGSTKVYLLMRLPRTHFDHLLAAKQHLVVSSRQRKTLAQMTLSELMEVVALLDGGPRDSAEAMVAACKRGARNLVRHITLLVDHHQHIPIGDLQDLHDAIADALHRLAHTFELEER